MMELDFLPDWYHVRKERRRSYFALIWLSACLVAVMGLWFHLAHSQIVRARSDLQELKDQRAAVNEELLKIDRLRAIRDDLVRKSTIAAQLHSRSDAIHVVGRLVELLPSDISLLDVKLKSQVIKVAEEQTPASQRPRRVSSNRRTGPAEPAQKTPDRTQYFLTISGVAPVDVTVANFIARLSASDAFQEVHMGYARDLKHEGRIMRQFMISCQLREDWVPWANVEDDKGVRTADAAAAATDEAIQALVGQNER